MGGVVVGNQKGYTLIEVMATIVILLALTLVILPNINGTASYIKLKASARTLVNEIRYTQQLAIANKAPATITFNKLDGTFKITQLLKNVKLGSLIEGVEFDTMSFKDNACIFSSDGSPNGGSIYIRFKDKYFTITVRPVTGRVVVYDYKK